MTSKTAASNMTPLDKVFMLSTDDRLDRTTLRRVLESGHSRVPVYEGSDRSKIAGLIITKELLQYVGLLAGPQVRIGSPWLSGRCRLLSLCCATLPCCVAFSAVCPLTEHKPAHINPATACANDELKRKQPPPRIGDIELRDALRLPVGTRMYHLLDIFQVILGV